MEMLLGLIDSLELNTSLFPLFGIFLVAYVFLYFVLFKPYNQAAQERYDRTHGAETSANEYDEEIELLKRQYGVKVKEVNEAVKGVFEEQDQLSKKEIQSILAKGQEEYRLEKETQESKIFSQFEVEKQKVPTLKKELKEAFKNVLMGS